MSFALGAKNTPKKFYRTKNNVIRLCQTSTEHNKMYLIFSNNGRAVKLESLIKTLAKIHVSEEDASPVQPSLVETAMNRGHESIYVYL